MPQNPNDRLGAERERLRKTFRHLHFVENRHDKTRKYVYYAKPGFPRIRLYADPVREPAKFRAEYEAATRGEPAPESDKVVRVAGRAGTWNAAIALYEQSHGYKKLRPNTLRAYDRWIAQLAGGLGSTLMERTSPGTLWALHDKVLRENGAITANTFQTILKGIFKVGRIHRWCPDDLLIGIEHQDHDSKSYRTYKGNEIDGWREEHEIGSEARFAFELAYALGLATSDLIRFSPSMIDADGFTWVSRIKNTNNQTTNTRTDPVLREMLELLDARRPAGTPADVPYLRSRQGRPYNADGNMFRKDWRRWCQEAGLPKDFTVHGCRATLVTDMMDAGVNNSDGMRRTGHLTEKVYREIYGQEASITKAVDRAQDQVVAMRARRAGKSSKPALRAVG